MERERGAPYDSKRNVNFRCPRYVTEYTVNLAIAHHVSKHFVPISSSSGP